MIHVIGLTSNDTIEEMSFSHKKVMIGSQSYFNTKLVAAEWNNKIRLKSNKK